MRAATRRVADHGNLFGGVEGQEVVLAALALRRSRPNPQNGGIVCSSLEAVVGDDLLDPSGKVAADPQPPVQRPCVDLLVFGDGQVGGGFVGVV